MYCLCHTHLRRIMFPMYVESVPNRNSPLAILLRESSRVDGKMVKRTLANLSLAGSSDRLCSWRVGWFWR